jgi:hypothetical protein
MEVFLLIVGLLLAIVSIIDWKLRVLPSVLLTSILFIVAFINPQNLWFGIMAFIVSYLLFELSYFNGVADLKIMTTIGFLITTTNWFFIYVGLVVIFGTFWKILIKWRLKNEKETAFLPIFFFIYLTLVFIGGIN